MLPVASCAPPSFLASFLTVCLYLFSLDSFMSVHVLSILFTLFLLHLEKSLSADENSQGASKIQDISPLLALHDQQRQSCMPDQQIDWTLRGLTPTRGQGFHPPSLLTHPLCHQPLEPGLRGPTPPKPTQHQADLAN
jgi:hypothetical protein